MTNQPPFLAHSLLRIDQFTELCGKSIAWLLLLMVLVQSLVVILRYGFNFGSIALQESVTYLHACCFMLGAAYTLKHDEHVRVDIFYRNFSEKKRAMVNLIGGLVFLIPLTILIFWVSLDYTQQAWAVKERSADAGGIPAVYWLKTLIPALAVTLCLQAVAETLRSILIINSFPRHLTK